MARPSIPIIVVFASDATYTNGPVPLQGTATKLDRSAGEHAEGYLGDETPPAQEFNAFFFSLSTWGRWVGQASAAADEDAHLIETDADGESKLARLVVGPHSLDSDGLFVTAGGSSGIGVNAIGKGIRPGIVGNCTGSAVGIDGFSINGAAGVSGRGVGGDSPGVTGDGDGTAAGVQGTNDSGGSGAGVLGTSGNAAAGVEGVSNNAAASPGVRGIASHVDGHGVRGQTNASATASSSAVIGFASADAVGVTGQNTADGYGVVAVGKTAAPKRSAFRVAPQAVDPTTHAAGDIIYSSAVGEFRGREIGGWQSFHQSPLGHVFAVGDGPTPSGSTAGGPASTVTAQFTPKQIGDVLITATIVLDSNVDNGATTLDIYDVTAAGVVETTPIRHADLDAAGGDQSETHVLRAKYTLPSLATRTIAIRVTATTGTTTWSKAVISVEGIVAS